LRANIFFTLWALLFVIAAQAQSPAEIARRYAQATGGVAAWKNLKTIAYSGTLKIDTQTYNVKFYQKTPNLYRLEALVENQVMIDAYDGKTAWDINPFGLYGEKSHRKTAAETAEAQQQNLQDNLINYEKKGSQLFLLDTINYNGTPVFYLKLIQKNQVESLYFIDRNTYLPQMTKVYIQAGLAAGAGIEMHYTDYRQVAGVVLPFAIKMVANDQVLQQINYTKADVNIDLNDGLFWYVE
jgi:outer membrane lipoprotein-sorting protein